MLAHQSVTRSTGGESRKEEDSLLCLRRNKNNFSVYALNESITEGELFVLISPSSSHSIAHNQPNTLFTSS